MVARTAFLRLKTILSLWVTLSTAERQACAVSFHTQPPVAWHVFRMTLKPLIMPREGFAMEAVTPLRYKLD